MSEYTWHLLVLDSSKEGRGNAWKGLRPEARVAESAEGLKREQAKATLLFLHLGDLRREGKGLSAEAIEVVTGLVREVDWTCVFSGDSTLPGRDGVLEQLPILGTDPSVCFYWKDVPHHIEVSGLKSHFLVCCEAVQEWVRGGRVDRLRPDYHAVLKNGWRAHSRELSGRFRNLLRAFILLNDSAGHEKLGILADEFADMKAEIQPNLPGYWKAVLVNNRLRDEFKKIGEQDIEGVLRALEGEKDWKDLQDKPEVKDAIEAYKAAWLKGSAAQDAE